MSTFKENKMVCGVLDVYVNLPLSWDRYNISAQSWHKMPFTEYQSVSVSFVWFCLSFSFLFNDA